MQNVFKDKDEERGNSVTDFINGLIDLLSLETRTVWDAWQNKIKPIKLWDKE